MQTISKSIFSDVEPQNKSNNVKKKMKTDEEYAQVKPSLVWNDLLSRKLMRLADQIKIPIEDLQWWLKGLQEKHVNLSINEFEWLALKMMHLAQTYHLDPLLGHVHAWQDSDHQWQVAISLDGLLTLLNREPNFDGLCISESQLEGGQNLVWAECVMYRKDRTIPTAYREYASEVVQESEIWRKMPRRMLKNKAVQQCARIAFGFGGPLMSEIEEQINTKSEIKDMLNKPSFKILSPKDQASGKQTERLKEHLLKEPETPS